MKENNPHPLNNYDGHMNTISGKKVSLKLPTPDQIETADIVAGLAYKPHFSGQTPRFFSIAEHCIIVKNLALRANPDAERIFLLACLLHDASEAYIGDMIKPLKMMIPDYSVVEFVFMRAICRKYNIPYQLLMQVKQFDREAQAIEYDCFYKGISSDLIAFYNPEEARVIFSSELNFLIK